MTTGASHGAPEGVPEVVVLLRRPGRLQRAIHFNEGGRPACRLQPAPGQVTGDVGAVTCGGCRRTRAYRRAVAGRDERRRRAEREAERLVPRALVWACPLCQARGRGDEGRCLECAGEGYLTEERAAAWRGPQGAEGAEGVEGVGLVRAPRPPAVRRRPCVDCRFRPGAQEEDAGAPLPGPERVFFCHEGMPMVAGAYRPLLWAGGMPVGAWVCAAWWDVMICGLPAPTQAARERIPTRP